MILVLIGAYLMMNSHPFVGLFLMFYGLSEN